MFSINSLALIDLDGIPSNHNVSIKLVLNSRKVGGTIEGLIDSINEVTLETAPSLIIELTINLVEYSINLISVLSIKSKRAST
jgi:hypothetical protein